MYNEPAYFKISERFSVINPDVPAKKELTYDLIPVFGDGNCLPSGYALILYVLILQKKISPSLMAIILNVAKEKIPVLEHRIEEYSTNTPTRQPFITGIKNFITSLKTKNPEVTQEVAKIVMKQIAEGIQSPPQLALFCVVFSPALRALSAKPDSEFVVDRQPVDAEQGINLAKLLNVNVMHLQTYEKKDSVITIDPNRNQIPKKSPDYILLYLSDQRHWEFSISTELKDTINAFGFLPESLSKPQEKIVQASSQKTPPPSPVKLSPWEGLSIRKSATYEPPIDAPPIGAKTPPFKKTMSSGAGSKANSSRGLLSSITRRTSSKQVGTLTPDPDLLIPANRPS